MLYKFVRTEGGIFLEQHSVAILLATYNPPLDWLAELLDSLDRQTYPNLRLYVRDDASAAITLDELDKLLREHITAFPYVLNRNEVNRGSNETFSALVSDCSEHYIAFCDQDDIWLPEKIENTVRLLEKSPLSPTVVCTNVSVIDGNGNPIADRIDQHRRRHVFLRGEGLAPTLIYRNFALGCTMVAARERIASYQPFPAEIVHDHYLLFRAALDGAIDYLDEPQMRYRVYGGNQTGVMTGVRTKSDYYTRRIEVYLRRISRFSEYADFPALDEAQAWGASRVANFKREKGGFRALWRMRHVNRVTSLFELFALRMPRPIFSLAIKLIQKGYL